METKKYCIMLVNIQSESGLALVLVCHQEHLQISLNLAMLCTIQEWGLGALARSQYQIKAMVLHLRIAIRYIENLTHKTIECTCELEAPVKLIFIISIIILGLECSRSLMRT